jgi:FAD/FMN-containing dehydrogenase
MENTPISLPAEKAVEQWIANLRGRVIRPTDPDYEKARRVYNAMIDRKPWCVMRCADVADVIHCINFAKEQRVPLAIRGGGHSVPGFGTCDQGIVVDLSGLKGIWVDESKRRVRVEGGCTWGDVDHATHVFGLATPGGIISTTGVGGLATGGGFGYLTRRYGLVCDNLVSAEIVTADGALRRASVTENPDLFWAIRGGSGNFGVVTSFEFKLHPVSQVYAGPVLYPLEQATQVMKRYRDFMRTAPRELSVFCAFLIVPPGPPFPEPLHGKTMCGLVACYCGNLSQGDSATGQLLKFGSPLFSHIGPMPYPVLQSAFDALVPPNLHHYWKADFVNDLTDEAIAVHVKYGAQVPTVNSAIHIYPLDGAVHDYGPDQTAFAYRDVRFVHILAAIGPDPTSMDKYRSYIREYYDALHPFSAGGSYVNSLMDEGADRVAGSCRGNYARLSAIKAKYDPGNLFCTNQNIKPAQ